MVWAADARSHRGDPPVFDGPSREGTHSCCCKYLRTERVRDADWRGETGARHSVVAAQEILKLPCMIPEYGSQAKRYVVPSFGLGTKLFVPVNSRLMSTRLKPGPLRWKS